MNLDLRLVLLRKMVFMSHVDLILHILEHYHRMWSNSLEVRKNAEQKN